MTMCLYPIHSRFLWSVIRFVVPFVRSTTRSTVRRIQSNNRGRWWTLGYHRLQRGQEETRHSVRLVGRVAMFQTVRDVAAGAFLSLILAGTPKRPLTPVFPFVNVEPAAP